MTPLGFGPVLVRGASVQDDRFFPFEDNGKLLWL